MKSHFVSIDRWSVTNFSLLLLLLFFGQSTISVRFNLHFFCLLEEIEVTSSDEDKTEVDNRSRR